MSQIKVRIIEKGSKSIKDAVHIQVYPLSEQQQYSVLNTHLGDKVDLYTGVQDDEYKDLYENDIVEVTYCPPVGDYITFRAFIVKSSLGWDLDYGSGSVDLSIAFEEDSCVALLGNLHFNEELLDGV